MRKVILYVAVSIDGYIARRNGDVDWLDFKSDFGHKEFNSSIDTVLMGYDTYIKSLSFGDKNIFKEHRYYVFTNKHLNEEHENVSFTNVRPGDLVTRLKSSEGKNIWLMGGGKLIQSFLRENCIDEMMLFVIPKILGEGIPLFPAPLNEANPTLVDSKNYEESVILLHYKFLK